MKSLTMDTTTWTEYRRENQIYLQKLQHSTYGDTSPALHGKDRTK